MLTINYKQIYETNEKDGCIYCDSIKKYVDVNKIADYNRSKMSRCIYVKENLLGYQKKILI